MIEIALIENDKEDEDRFNKIVNDYFRSINEACNITVYGSSEAFLDAYNGQFQIVFMDIELPGMNGMDAAKKLREKDEGVLLIFLTNLAHYAIAGYEVNAADYILKPLKADAFRLKIPKVLAIIKQNHQKKLTVMTKGDVHTFTTDDLYYVEVLSHRLYYHTKKGVFDVRGTISDAERELFNYDFRRCNNSLLVNLKHVSSIEGNNAKVGPDLLPISRPKKKTFVNELTNYLGGQL